MSPELYRRFVLWALLSMGYFYPSLIRPAWQVPCVPLRRTVFLLTFAACLSLCYSVFIPYLPHEIPGWARLHVILAAGSAVLLMAALLLLLLYRRARGLLWAWLALSIFCGLLLLRCGMVTTALEVCFTLSAALLTHALRPKPTF